MFIPPGYEHHVPFYPPAVNIPGAFDGENHLSAYFLPVVRYQMEMYLPMTGIYPRQVKPLSVHGNLSSHRELDQTAGLRVQALASDDLA